MMVYEGYPPNSEVDQCQGQCMLNLIIPDLILSKPGTRRRVKPPLDKKGHIFLILFNNSKLKVQSLGTNYVHPHYSLQFIYFV